MVAASLASKQASKLLAGWPPSSLEERCELARAADEKISLRRRVCSCVSQYVMSMIFVSHRKYKFDSVSSITVGVKVGQLLIGDRKQQDNAASLSIVSSQK